MREMPASVVHELADVDGSDRSDGDTLIWHDDDQTHRYGPALAVVVADEPPESPNHGLIYVDTTAEGINADGSRT